MQHVAVFGNDVALLFFISSRRSIFHCWNSNRRCCCSVCYLPCYCTKKYKQYTMWCLASAMEMPYAMRCGAALRRVWALWLSLPDFKCGITFQYLVNDGQTLHRKHQNFLPPHAPRPFHFPSQHIVSRTPPSTMGVFGGSSDAKNDPNYVSDGKMNRSDDSSFRRSGLDVSFRTMMKWMHHGDLSSHPGRLIRAPIPFDPFPIAVGKPQLTCLALSSVLELAVKPPGSGS